MLLQDIRNLNQSHIALVPQTVAELPPVAGLLTRQAGNALSHVQLLARNLGIPNVVVSEPLVERLRLREGKRVVVAASPGGQVEISDYSPRWNSLFRPDLQQKKVLLKPDTEKLDLSKNSVIPLDQLTKADSGRIVGPKAAHLAELNSHFPGAVAPAVVLPFGMFADLMKQKIAPNGGALQDWFIQEYQSLSIDKRHLSSTRASLNKILEKLRHSIETLRFSPFFVEKLRTAFNQQLDISKGVFVRSDTNVEDLPGFTGAGLNRTVPNVTNFSRLLSAILRVWASPFTERAFLWRQAHLTTPNEVYASVIIQKSVPVDKSGVLLTQEINTASRDSITIAANWGIGGVVSNQLAEVLVVNRSTGRVRLLSSATALERKALSPRGGLRKVKTSVKQTERVLSQQEIVKLLEFTKQLPQHFPEYLNAAADVEFGFLGGKLVLFQIRPFVESSEALSNSYLMKMDKRVEAANARAVDLNAKPMDSYLQ